jgi:uncharacterized protein (DUF58 family)
MQALVAVLLLLGGAVFDVPVAVLLGTVGIFLESVRQVWRRWGLRGVTYRRVLGRPAVAWGETIPLSIEVWNRKRLPLAWLRADDSAEDGVTVREAGHLAADDTSVSLRNLWTLAPFERVRREFHVGGDHRGMFELGPVEVAVSDPFGREAVSHELQTVDRFLVRPRIVGADPPLVERPDGLHRAAAGLSEDPSRFAGVREYAPGDPLRRVHHRTSARLGQLMVKRFEPSSEREVLLAVDIETSGGFGAFPGAFHYDEDEVESLYVVAASLVHALAADHVAVGFAAAGYTGAPRPIVYVPVSAARDQAERIVDMIARLSPSPSASFARLLSLVGGAVRPGTTVVVLSGRSLLPFLRHLRAVRSRASSLTVLACGPAAVEDAAEARSVGFDARAVRLDGPWETADRLVVLA